MLKSLERLLQFWKALAILGGLCCSEEANKWTPSLQTRQPYFSSLTSSSLHFFPLAATVPV